MPSRFALTWFRWSSSLVPNAGARQAVAVARHVVDTPNRDLGQPLANPPVVRFSQRDRGRLLRALCRTKTGPTAWLSG